jgi:hypothetical protein
MRRTSLAGGAVAAVLLAALVAAAADDAPTFRIRDRLAIDEVAEVTTVYVDGAMVKSFRLDGAERDVTIPVTVPDQQGPHHYALCGHIQIREPDGHVRTQAFAVGGTIADVAGREFEAYASDNFTHFFLIDTTEGRIPTVIEPTETNVCTPAVS